MATTEERTAGPARTPPGGHEPGGHRGLPWRGGGPYLPLLALMLASSTASFAALGVLSLFAHDQVGASGTEVTLIFVAVALAGMLVLPATGRLSDRTGARRVLVPVSLLWLGAGYAILSAVRSYPAMLAASVVFFCAVGVPSAQLMAHARVLVAGRRDDTAATAVLTMMRIVLSVGSFTGFGVGGLGLAYLGARAVFRLVALACLCCAALAWYVLRPVATGPSTATGVPRTAGSIRARRGIPYRPRRGRVAGAPPDRLPDLAGAAGSGAAGPAGAGRGGGRLLLTLTLVMVLFASGRVMVVSQLPILIRTVLHAPVQLTGVALALPPLCELVLMPLAAYAALRWGRGRVFLAGGAASVLYYTGLVVVRTPGQLMLLQVGYAIFGAATIMVGIDLAQRLVAGHPGAATSTYLSYENVATVNGSLVATVSIATLGVRAGFAVPAALCLVALALAATTFARHPYRFDLTRTPRGCHTGRQDA